MLIEISLLLKLQLYLGKPVYTLGIALFAFLLSSGIGSCVSGRLPVARPVGAGRVSAPAGIVIYGAAAAGAVAAMQEATIAYSDACARRYSRGNGFPARVPDGPALSASASDLSQTATDR